MSEQTIAELETELYEKTLQLHKLKQDADRVEIANYYFATLSGEVSLKDLFADSDTLLMIHNMGQGCRYCTVWGDGLNGFLPHLESAMSVVMASKDDPHTQKRFANSRGWRFRMASHGGGDYIAEQTVVADASNMPGVVCYHLQDDKILRSNSATFGPGDLYCSLWSFLAMAGLTTDEFTPQYNYWSRPAKLEDGGENIVD
ncbi:MAG: DUF899 family protein [Arenicella sp.]|nr:DUF899 family protein [Arenicella sp.]